MISAPASACSASASAALRWSFQRIAGRRTWPFSSVRTAIWAPAEIPTAAMSPPLSLAPARARGRARHKACHQSEGSCSDQPGLGVRVAMGWLASPTRPPDSSMIVALRLPAPRSTPSR